MKINYCEYEYCEVDFNEWMNLDLQRLCPTFWTEKEKTTGLTHSSALFSYSNITNVNAQARSINKPQNCNPVKGYYYDRNEMIE